MERVGELRAAPRLAGREGVGESELVCVTREDGERAAHASRPRRPLSAGRYRYRYRARWPICAGNRPTISSQLLSLLGLGLLVFGPGQGEGKGRHGLVTQIKPRIRKH